MKQRAFSLVELIVVIAIIAIFASIGFVHGQSSRRAAQVVQTKANLRQAHLAMELYRNDNELHTGDSISNIAGEHVLELIKKNKFYGATFSTIETACGHHPTARSPRFTMHFGGEPSEQVERFLLRLGERRIMWSDDNCNDHSVKLNEEHFPRLGLAVQFDGSLVSKRKTGQVWHDYFWHSPWE
jgi:prepilin-type N-terminal cleavage/methylation domain-containing protein